MLVTISKWGNSRAIRLPKALAEAAGLKVGSEVDIRFQEGEIRIRRARKPRRYDLDDLLATVPEDFEPEDWDIGPPVGNEVW